MKKILIIDDDFRTKMYFDKLWLPEQKEKVDVVFANTISDAEIKLNKHNFDLVISDLRLPKTYDADSFPKNKSAVDLLEYIIKDKKINVVVFSDYYSDKLDKLFLKLKIPFLNKSNLDLLFIIVTKTLNSKSKMPLNKNLKNLKKVIENLNPEDHFKNWILKDLKKALLNKKITISSETQKLLLKMAWIQSEIKKTKAVGLHKQLVDEYLTLSRYKLFIEKHGLKEYLILKGLFKEMYFFKRKQHTVPDLDKNTFVESYKKYTKKFNDIKLDVVNKKSDVKKLKLKSKPKIKIIRK